MVIIKTKSYKRLSKCILSFDVNSSKEAHCLKLSGELFHSCEVVK